MYHFGLFWLVVLPDCTICDGTEKRTCFVIEGLFVSVSVVDESERVVDLLVIVVSSASS